MKKIYKQGLTNNELKIFEDLQIKANTKQIKAMITSLKNNLKKRGVLNE